MRHIPDWCPHRPDDSVGSSGVEVTGKCELPCVSAVRTVTNYILRAIFLAPETSSIIFKTLFCRLGVLYTCVSVYHMHVWCLQRPEESVLSPGTCVKDSCESPI